VRQDTSSENVPNPALAKAGGPGNDCQALQGQGRQYNPIPLVVVVVTLPAPREPVQKCPAPDSGLADRGGSASMQAQHRLEKNDDAPRGT